MIVCIYKKQFSYWRIKNVLQIYNTSSGFGALLDQRVNPVDVGWCLFSQNDHVQSALVMSWNVCSVWYDFLSNPDLIWLHCKLLPRQWCRSIPAKSIATNLPSLLNKKAWLIRTFKSEHVLIWLWAEITS